MIDERFSAVAFEKAGYGSKAARCLSEELSNEVEEELDIVLQPAMLQVIAKLNALGHKLIPFEEQLPNHKHFREPLLNGPWPHYKFLVALDVIISVGYPETVDKNPLEEE